MKRKLQLFIGIGIALVPTILKAQCPGSWSPVTTTTYLCAEGPFLRYSTGENNCPSSAQAWYTFSEPVESVKLAFSAFGTKGFAGQSRLSVFLNDTSNKIDLKRAGYITLGCQNPAGAYSIDDGCLIDSIQGADGGLAGYIYLSADSFSLSSITLIGVAVSEPGATGTIFEINSCSGPTGLLDFTPGKSVIYPNPFTDNLTINRENNETVEIIIYDISLRAVLKATINRSLLLNTDGLDKGIYIYTVTMKDKTMEKGKIIKE